MKTPSSTGFWVIGNILLIFVFPVGAIGLVFTFMMSKAFEVGDFESGYNYRKCATVTYVIGSVMLGIMLAVSVWFLLHMFVGLYNYSNFHL